MSFSEPSGAAWSACFDADAPLEDFCRALTLVAAHCAMHAPGAAAAGAGLQPVVAELTSATAMFALASLAQGPSPPVDPSAPPVEQL